MQKSHFLFPDQNYGKKEDDDDNDDDDESDTVTT